MTWSCRGALTAAVLLIGAVAAMPGAAPAQDTTWKEGVRITGIYTPGSKPGVLVLPVGGTTGDSLREMFQRDLDFGDRVNVVALPVESVPPPSPAVTNTRSAPSIA